MMVAVSSSIPMPSSVGEMVRELEIQGEASGYGHWVQRVCLLVKWISSLASFRLSG
jgi:hypothetical protein